MIFKANRQKEISTNVPDIEKLFSGFFVNLGGKDFRRKPIKPPFAVCKPSAYCGVNGCVLLKVNFQRSHPFTPQRVTSFLLQTAKGR